MRIDRTYGYDYKQICICKCPVSTNFMSWNFDVEDQNASKTVIELYNKPTSEV